MALEWCLGLGKNVVVAILGGLSSRTSFCLSEIALKLDSSVYGNCLILDATADVLLLLNRIKEVKPSKLVLITSGKEGIKEHIVKPYSSQEVRKLDDIIRRLWPNLTGSLDPNDYIEAMKILYDREFVVVQLTGDKNECMKNLNKFLSKYCLGQ